MNSKVRQPRPVLVLAVTASRSAVLIKGQISYYREHGFDVALVSSPGPEIEALAREEGATFFAIPMARTVSPRSDALALARLFALFWRLSPQIVNAGTPKAGLLATVAATMAGVPVRFYTLRGLRFEGYEGLRRKFFGVVEKLVCSLSHRTICVSPSLLSVCMEERILVPQKAIILGQGSSNGVDTSRFAIDERRHTASLKTRRQLGIPDSAFVFGFLGRLVRDKGIVELAEAWERFSHNRPGGHLIIGGDFEPANPVPAATRRFLESRPEIHCLGKIAAPEEFYPLINLLVLPSHREGFPNVVLEAASAGRACITTLTTGCRDAVVDGITGRLVPAGDIVALESALAHYFDNPSLAQLHGEAALARTRREFRCDRIWGGLVREYRAALIRAGSLNAISHLQVDKSLAKQRPLRRT